MTTLPDERPGPVPEGTDDERDLAGPITTLVLLVAALVAAAFWGTDAVGAGSSADPATIRIPAIGVVAPVDPLFIDADGVLPPPDSYDGTGWWHAGPEPGEDGPAVIAGHIDSRSGPAVFYRLGELAPGDEIHVDRVDGSTVTFVARRTEQHDKDTFPTAEVYGDTPGPALRLVTCGGEFDQAARSYDDNVIVWADHVRG